MRRVLLDNMELWLSLAGVAVILSVPHVLHATGAAAWRVGALAATFVGVLHGLIFWVVRRRQREMRRQAIAEIREMLRDRVNNSLTVISISLSDVKDPESAESVKDLQNAVEHISTLVSSLSDESVRSWKRRYAGTMTRSTS